MYYLLDRKPLENLAQSADALEKELKRLLGLIPNSDKGSQGMVRRANQMNAQWSKE